MTVLARPLRLGTRRSALALAQTQALAAMQAQSGLAPVELVEVTTYGDASADAISTLGGTGVFVTALRERLLAGEIDLAVHSLKDLPSAAVPELTLAAVPPREDPRDVLVSAGRRLAELPAGARIGTGSPRRTAQLRAYRRDLEIVPIRGNVDTRLGKVATGEFDAVVLAYAGLARLGRLDAVTELLPPELMLPAPRQGALAVECRGDDTAILAALRPLDEPATRAAVTAERAVLAAVEAGCTAPLGTLADVRGDRIDLTAAVAAIDGGRVVRLAASGHLGSAEETGRRLAADLLRAGAADLLGETR